MRAARNTSNVNHLQPEKRLTRASSKTVDGSGIVRRGAFADQRNLQPAKIIDKNNFVKDEVKKVVTVIDITKENDKENLISKSEKEVASYTQSRFDAVVLHCDEYKEDVENYMFCLEKRFGVRANFLSGLEVTPRMRAVLIDWLIQVHVRFHLLPETLFLTINVLDRYLALGKTTKDTLQLVGVACLAAAAKYEEIFPPEILDYVYITENAISKHEIIRMENKVLSALSVNLGRPSVIQFVRRLSTFFNPRVHVLSKFISESMVLNYKTCNLEPSTVAAVSVWMAAKLEDCPFSEALFRKARVSKDDIISIVPTAALHLLEVLKSTKLIGLREKYGSSKNGRASLLNNVQMNIITCLAEKDEAFLSSLH